MDVKPRFRLRRRGWYFRPSFSQFCAVKAFPGANAATMEVGPFRSFGAAYDAVRWHLGLDG